MVCGMNQGHSISENWNAVFEKRRRAEVVGCAENGVICVSNSDIERQYSALFATCEEKTTAHIWNMGNAENDQN